MAGRSMDRISDADSYRSPDARIPFLPRRFPSLFFYYRMLGIYWRSSKLAKAGRYGDREWAASSLEVLRGLEEIGVRVSVENLTVLEDLNTPCVFIGNHISNLETFVLPCVISPYMPVTFIVKELLIRYPVFRHVMISRDPIVVGRKDAREDLRTVLEGGQERLDRGISIIVFPQTTRTPVFQPESFNTIGVKLARRAGFPVVPIALKTDAWGIGRPLKDFGRIQTEIPVHFRFGDPMTVTGNGREEHERIVRFIQESLEEWSVERWP